MDIRGATDQARKLKQQLVDHAETPGFARRMERELALTPGCAGEDQETYRTARMQASERMIFAPPAPGRPALRRARALEITARNHETFARFFEGPIAEGTAQDVIEAFDELCRELDGYSTEFRFGPVEFEVEELRRRVDDLDDAAGQESFDGWEEEWQKEWEALERSEYVLVHHPVRGLHLTYGLSVAAIALDESLQEDTCPGCRSIARSSSCAPRSSGPTFRPACSISSSRGLSAGGPQVGDPRTARDPAAYGWSPARYSSSRMLITMASAQVSPSR